MSTDPKKMMNLKNQEGLFFHADEILVRRINNQFLIPLAAIYPHGLPDGFEKNAFYENNIYAFEISPEIIINNEQFYFLPLRQVLETFDPISAAYPIICRAKHLLYWHRMSQFCGACGGVNEMSQIEIAKICQQCHRVSYPYYHPAVLVLIERGNEMLLARSPHFRKGVYAPLAGFVSPSETAEEAVVREVHEEVGLKIDNLRYFKNQSWPFPNSFMVGYFAEYVAGEIQLDTRELEDARWFTADQLPDSLPSKTSISRQLVDDFLWRRT